MEKSIKSIQIVDREIYVAIAVHSTVRNANIYISLIHSLEKEVCAQLFDLEKRFKICYVYVKRKPRWYFSFFLSSNFEFLVFTLMNANALVYVELFFLKSDIRLIMNTLDVVNCLNTTSSSKSKMHILHF